MEENKRILDLTNLNMSDAEFEAIKRGLDAAVANGHIRRYFGYADRHNLKTICKWCGYVDKGAMWKGAVAAWIGMAGGAVVIHLLEKRRKKPNEQIIMMSVAKDEESE